MSFICENVWDPELQKSIENIDLFSMGRKVNCLQAAWGTIYGENLV